MTRQQSTISWLPISTMHSHTFVKPFVPSSSKSPTSMACVSCQWTELDSQNYQSTRRKMYQPLVPLSVHTSIFILKVSFLLFCIYLWISLLLFGSIVSGSPPSSYIYIYIIVLLLFLLLCFYISIISVLLISLHFPFSLLLLYFKFIYDGLLIFRIFLLILFFFFFLILSTLCFSFSFSPSSWSQEASRTPKCREFID